MIRSCRIKRCKVTSIQIIVPQGIIVKLGLSAYILPLILLVQMYICMGYLLYRLTHSWYEYSQTICLHLSSPPACYSCEYGSSRYAFVDIAGSVSSHHRFIANLIGIHIQTLAFVCTAFLNHLHHTEKWYSCMVCCHVLASVFPCAGQSGRIDSCSLLRSNQTEGIKENLC